MGKNPPLAISKIEKSTLFFDMVETFILSIDKVENSTPAFDRVEKSTLSING